jgi:hypothetical protein
MEELNTGGLLLPVCCCHGPCCHGLRITLS